MAKRLTTIINLKKNSQPTKQTNSKTTEIRATVFAPLSKHQSVSKRKVVKTRIHKTIWLVFQSVLEKNNKNKLTDQSKLPWFVQWIIICILLYALTRHFLKMPYYSLFPKRDVYGITAVSCCIINIFEKV